MPFFQPNNLSGLYLWFRSTSVTGIIPNTNAPSWVDDSGSGNNTNTPAFAVNFPTYQTGVINGFPSMRFAGNSFLSTITNNTSLNNAASSVTLFSVFKTNNFTTAQTIFSCDNPNNSNSAWTVGLNQIKVVNPSGFSFCYGKNANIIPNNGFLSIEASSTSNGFKVCPVNTWVIRHDRFRPTDRVFAFGLNGVDIATGIATTRISTSNIFKIGNDDTVTTDLFNGDIAEIVGYNRMLSDFEVSEVNSYLKQKYNIGSIANFPLFIYCDNPSGIYKDFPLYVKGGVTANSSVRLFIDSAAAINSSVKLYTDSSAVVNSSLKLYIDSSTPSNSSVKLYISGKGLLNNNFRLYLDSSTPLHSSIPLYTQSVNIKNSSMKLYTDSATQTNKFTTLFLDSSTKATSGIKLYTDSSTKANSGFKMYTSGTLGSQHTNISLYIDSSTIKNSSIKLYSIGGITKISGNISLYIDSSAKLNSGVKLYTNAISHTGAKMNLYINSNPNPKDNNSFTLFEYASHPGTKELYNKFPFYVYGGGSHANMPLYISTIKDNPTARMPLFISGPINTGTRNNFIPFYVANNITGTGPPGLLPLVKLFTQGAGQLDGGSVINGKMPLYLRRNNSGIYQGISLYTMAGKINSGISMVIKSASFVNSGVLLSIRGTGVKNNFSLYVRGPTAANSGMKMYIQGKPVTNNDLPFYVGGF